MVTLLRKIFVKNYKNVDDPKVRTAHGKLAAGFGIFSNIILFGMKLVFGIISASISIIADSINNLSDFASSTITLLGFKFSSKPADKEHPFGHQRIEYIAGLIVSIVIVALAIVLAYTSVMKMVEYKVDDPSIFVFSQPWPFIILGIAIVFKLLQSLFNFRMSKIIKSVALKATAVDSLTDSISTLLILIGAIVCAICEQNSVKIPFSLDGLIGIVVALFVGFSGVKMILETSSPLIGESTSMEEIEKIVKEIESYDGVLGVHDMMAHNYGPTKIFMTIHVEVDSTVDVLTSHELMDDIEKDIKQKFDVELTVHMDPIEISNPEIQRLKEKVLNFIKEKNLNYTIHDFRMVFGTGHKNILFDVVVPFEDKIKETELVRLFEDAVNENEDVKINVVIHVDRPFVEK